jgi:glutathione synthase/RimK-type ligase-like ATP-grasp enzyme
MSHRRVALATYEKSPELSHDDRLLIPALAAHGIATQAVAWSAPAGPWSAFDAIILRSCWDYHLNIERFTEWLDRVERDGPPLWNPPALVRWNSDKRYLADLAQRGVATIPTIHVGRGDAKDLDAVLAGQGWRRIVIKPCISASGYETHALNVPLDASARALISRVVRLGDILVQPFVDEISRDGELSLVFIDGSYSHAALKRTTGGEFRVQAEHGGTLEPVIVDESLIEQAHAALVAAPESSLYARVDGIVRDRRFVLMELELIEPNLFLGLEPGAPSRLAAAVAGRL